jgi:hypothetical protein
MTDSDHILSPEEKKERKRVYMREYLKQWGKRNSSRYKIYRAKRKDKKCAYDKERRKKLEIENPGWDRKRNNIYRIKMADKNKNVWQKNYRERNKEKIKVRIREWKRNNKAKRCKDQAKAPRCIFAKNTDMGRF